MTKHFDTLKHEVWLPYRFGVGPTFKRFFDGLMDKKLLGNKCPKCSKTFVPARTFCPECYVDMDEWVELSQEGEVITWTLCNHEFYGMPVAPPFIAGLIKLDGADCSLLHLIGGFDLSSQDSVAERISHGIRVKAVWKEERVGSILDIMHFQPPPNGN